MYNIRNDTQLRLLLFVFKCGRTCLRRLVVVHGTIPASLLLRVAMRNNWALNILALSMNVTGSARETAGLLIQRHRSALLSGPSRRHL